MPFKILSTSWVIESIRKLLLLENLLWYFSLFLNIYLGLIFPLWTKRPLFKTSLLIRFRLYIWTFLLLLLHLLLVSLMLLPHLTPISLLIEINSLLSYSILVIFPWWRNFKFILRKISWMEASIMFPVSL